MTIPLRVCFFIFVFTILNFSVFFNTLSQVSFLIQSDFPELSVKSKKKNKQTTNS